ncbi:hypothetical protein LR948_11135 [Roseivivax sp. GX 12232]|uniref:hypothetical protein n=1 Tax=Roseivivax sp. GX 12232 TaxID=2900547 RepID=UPI001E52DB31|nr:hypothetical protein [Roseivivax sp. GX 12232]MCE0505913.1 hypothetical protein [Roseivivax sp. GX 12232]
MITADREGGTSPDSKEHRMGVFSTASKAAMAAAVPSPNTMQTVFDETPEGTERTRVARLGEYFSAPLSALDGAGVDLVTWFEANFPHPKILGAQPLPGAARAFWSSRTAYAKWREVVHRRIRTTLGLVEAQKAVRARVDAWTPFLSLLESLSKDHGPVHPGTFGAIRSLSDRARTAELDPLDLTPDQVPAFLEALPVHERGSSMTALKALDRLKRFPQIAGHLPSDYDTAYLLPPSRSVVPKEIRRKIAEMVKVARFDHSTYDDVSESCTENFNEQTAQTYHAAFVTLARAAKESGQVDLASLDSLSPLFKKKNRIEAIRSLIDRAETDAGFSLRTAADYVRIVAQIGEANGFKMKGWRRSLKKNPALKEGHAAGEKMSPKNQEFCERLIHNPSDVRTFLRQHVLYQERAQDILATDKPIPKEKLRTARRLATCAAFSTLEIRGAGLRKGSALAAQCEGAQQNFFRKTSGGKKLFELRLARKDMKGGYVEMPPIHVRDDKYCGYEVLDWYLTTARPLFDYANPEFCEKEKFARATHLFVAEKSARPLGGATFYNWMIRSSAEIGLPMFPHNFRHGFATLLLARSWSNRGRAAAYLGCSVGVLDTYYGWIDKRQKLEEVQDLLAEAMSGL